MTNYFIDPSDRYFRRRFFILKAFEPVENEEKGVEEAKEVEDLNEEDDEENAAEESSDSVGKTVTKIFDDMQCRRY